MYMEDQISHLKDWGKKKKKETIVENLEYERKLYKPE